LDVVVRQVPQFVVDERKQLSQSLFIPLRHLPRRALTDEAKGFDTAPDPAARESRKDNRRPA